MNLTHLNVIMGRVRRMALLCLCLHAAASFAQLSGEVDITRRFTHC